MNPIVSACGLLCNECNFYNKECTGCHIVAGKTFWAKEMTPSGICPLYDCSVNQKKYTNCGNCSELPCALFLQLKDPASSEEEHAESIKKRVSILTSK